jgi:hypothetical protein
MQQRQLRLGDILDDYCPRERRLTNHAVVAMVGDDVKQTRCTTCDAEHEYKHAKVPRQRRKQEAPAALYSPVAAAAPKRVAPANRGEEAPPAAETETPEEQPQSHIEEFAVRAEVTEPPVPVIEEPVIEEKEPDADAMPLAAGAPSEDNGDEDETEADADREKGPVHRPLIRASLPRPEGQAPPQRPAPEFTIRQPGGRPNRFRPRHHRGGGGQFQGNRSNGNIAGPMRGGPPRQGGRPPMASRHQGRKRSK